jgi:hypothetical protein
MGKFIAIIGALVAGGLGIALVSSAQAAHAALTTNKLTVVPYLFYFFTN